MLILCVADQDLRRGSGTYCVCCYRKGNPVYTVAPTPQPSWPIPRRCESQSQSQGAWDPTPQGVRIPVLGRRVAADRAGGTKGPTRTCQLRLRIWGCPTLGVDQSVSPSDPLEECFFFFYLRLRLNQLRASESSISTTASGEGLSCSGPPRGRMARGNWSRCVVCQNPVRNEAKQRSDSQ